MPAKKDTQLESCARTRPKPPNSSSTTAAEQLPVPMNESGDTSNKMTDQANVLSSSTAADSIAKPSPMDSSEDGECSSSVDDANAAACPIRKRRFSNARIQPTRVKKVMQSDEDIGRMVASVPVAIGSAMEHFAEKLLEAAAACVPSSSSRTLSPMHIKFAIMKNPHFTFLEAVIKDIKLPKVSDIQGTSSTPNRPEVGNSLPIPPYISQLFSGTAAGAGPSTSSVSSIALPSRMPSLSVDPTTSTIDFAAVLGRLKASGNGGGGCSALMGANSSVPMFMPSPQPSGSDLTSVLSTSSSTNLSTSVFSSLAPPSSSHLASGGEQYEGGQFNNHFSDNSNGNGNLVVKRKRGRPPRADRPNNGNGSPSPRVDNTTAVQAGNLLATQICNGAPPKRQFSVGEELDRSLMPPPTKVPPARMAATSLNGNAVVGLPAIIEDDDDDIAAKEPTLPVDLQE